MSWYLIEMPDGALMPYVTETDIGMVCGWGEMPKRKVDLDELLGVADECDEADVDGVTDWAARMSCDPFEWTCARCGKTYTNPFFTSYPREFWKDNKKRVGEVCEECRNEVDDKSSSIRKEKK